MDKNERQTSKEPRITRFVDLAARLLPGAKSDGPDLAESLDLLQWASRHQLDALGMACPLEDACEVPQGAGRRFVQLSEAARALGLELDLYLAPIVPLYLINDQNLGRLRTLALGPHRVVFVNLPATHDLKGAARVLRLVPFAGMTAVVVAPERNPEVQRLPELVRYVLQVGALCVADAGCLLGEEGHGSAITARRVWSLGYYSFVTGFVRGASPPIPPGMVNSFVESIEPGWRESQGRNVGITDRARRLLQ